MYICYDDIKLFHQGCNCSLVGRGLSYNVKSPGFNPQHYITGCGGGVGLQTGTWEIEAGISKGQDQSQPYKVLSIIY